MRPANSDAALDVLPYEDPSRIFPSEPITHVTHFLFPMSVPILFFIFFTSFSYVTGRNLQASIRVWSQVTQQLG